MTDNDIKILSITSADELAGFSLEGWFSETSGYRPLLSGMDDLLRVSEKEDTALVIATENGGGIVGFALLEPPLPDERWARLGKGLIYEVTALEVCQDWRSQGLSKRVLQLLVNGCDPEQKLLYMVGYSWTWDLDGKGLDPISYRDMLIRLFSSQGFEIYKTNEPNVVMRPENLLMARRGRLLPEAVVKRFKLLRFDLDRIDQPAEMALGV